MKTPPEMTPGVVGEKAAPPNERSLPPPTRDSSDEEKSPKSAECVIRRSASSSGRRVDEPYCVRRRRRLVEYRTGQVRANFSLSDPYKPGDVGLPRYARPETAKERASGRASTRPARSVTFQRVPSMLLPRVRAVVLPNVAEKTLAWGRPSVVPYDRQHSFELSARARSINDDPDTSRDQPTGSGSAPAPAETSRTLLPLASPPSSLVSRDLEGQRYLDSFADVTSSLRELRERNKSEESSGHANDGESDSSFLDHIRCPECRKLIQERGRVDEFVKDWLAIVRTNFQALPKHNHVVRGSAPHFCNFVRNKKLHQRQLQTPSGGHEHKTHTGSDPGWGLLKRSSGDSKAGRRARPSSPVDLDTSEDAVRADDESAVVPTVRITKKEPKSVENKPAESKAAWSQNGTNQNEVTADAVRQTTPSADPGVHVESSQSHGVTDDGSDQAKYPQKLDGTESDSSKNDPSTTSGRLRHKRERRPVRRKDKKVFARECNGRDEGALIPPREETIEEAEEPEEAPKTPDPVQTAPVPVPPPSVPAYKRNAKQVKGQQRKLSNHSLILTDFSKFKVDVSPDTESLSTPGSVEFSLTMTHNDHSQKVGASPWTQGRLALSQQSSRFELPMDMKVLETMTPTEYLSKYCVVTSKRQWLYEKIYLKHKEAKLGGLSLKGLDKALREALVDTVSSDDVAEIIELVGLTNSTKIDQKLFTGIAAMTERLLYPKFLTDDTTNIKDHKKEKIECADFCALEWKMHGIQVNPSIKKLLESL